MKSLALAIGVLTAPVAASEITFYRCTDASGALTVQNMPCPKGVQQTTKVMQAPSMPPAIPAAAPAVPPPVPAVNPEAASQAETAAPAADRSAHARRHRPPADSTLPAKPLPTLLHCSPRTGEAYLHVGDEAPTRCETLRVTGLDGNPMTGAGEACEVVRDTCKPVSEATRCQRWHEHQQDAERRWRFATPTQQDRLRADYETLKLQIAASDCALPAQKP